MDSCRSHTTLPLCLASALGLLLTFAGTAAWGQVLVLPNRANSWEIRPAPPNSQAQRPADTAQDSASAYDHATRLLDPKGISVLVGVSSGRHYFEDGPTPPNYYSGSSNDTNIGDQWGEYPLLRLGFRESHFDIDTANQFILVRLGYRVVLSGGKFAADREFSGDDDEDGNYNKSRFNATGEYLFVVPQLVARFGSTEPGIGWSRAFAYGMGPGYGRFHGKVEDPKDPEGPPRRVSESGMGWADVIYIEGNYNRWVLLMEVEQVHLNRRGRYFSLGYGAIGLAYLWTF